jgi:hypothetical protein
VNTGTMTRKYITSAMSPRSSLSLKKSEVFQTLWSKTASARPTSGSATRARRRAAWLAKPSPMPVMLVNSGCA